MSPETPNRPRVGIPWRTSEEEAQDNRPKIANYEDAVRKAGGEPVLIPLNDRTKQGRIIPELDAFVLPGSPADVEPAEYGAVNQGKSAPADLPREQADRAILAHAFAEKETCSGHLLRVPALECLSGRDADSGRALGAWDHDAAPEEGRFAGTEGRSDSWGEVRAGEPAGRAGNERAGQNQ